MSLSSQRIRKRLPQASSERAPWLKSCSSCRLLRVGQPFVCWARNALAAVWICAASARDEDCPSRALPRLPSNQMLEAPAPSTSTASAAAIGVTPREREREPERERAGVMVDGTGLATDVPARDTRHSAKNACLVRTTRRATAVKLTRGRAAYIRRLSIWQSAAVCLLDARSCAAVLNRHGGCRPGRSCRGSADSEGRRRASDRAAV